MRRQGEVLGQRSSLCATKHAVSHSLEHNYKDPGESILTWEVTKIIV